MKAVAIVSSGLDSAVNLAWAAAERTFLVVRSVTFDYGQRAARREVERSRTLSLKYGVQHETIPLPFLQAWTNTSLVEKKKSLPELEAALLDNPAATKASALAVWVPNRNGIFLNVGAALAESLGAECLIVGFNAEEGRTFPDNSPSFVEAINKSLCYSTLNHVTVVSRTLNLNKTEIVKLGLEVNLPFELIWSCYEGYEKMCGVCESCLRLKRAVEREAPQLMEVLTFAD